jgi:hypothetical protein
MQDNTTAHCVQFYGCIRWSLQNMSHKCKILASTITQLNPCDFYLWGILQKQVCKQSAFLENFHENIKHEIYDIPYFYMCLETYSCDMKHAY